MKELSEDFKKEIEVSKLSPIVYWCIKSFDWNPRWYQMLLLNSIFIHDKVCFRIGRQAGKTECLALMSLYLAFCKPITETKNKRVTKDGKRVYVKTKTKKGARILVASAKYDWARTVYERALSFLDKNNKYKEALAEGVIISKGSASSSGWEIRFPNGAVIDFKGPGEGGDAPRSKSYDYKLYDEADRMPHAFWVAELSTSINSPSDIVVLSSTPTGRRDHFYHCCTDPTMRFKEYHFSSKVNPNWDDEEERKHRKQLTEIEYMHEVEADWGTVEHGVFNWKYFEKCLLEYSNYVYVDLNYTITQSILKSGLTLENYVLNKISRLSLSRYNKYWFGADLGYTDDPSEYVVYEESNGIMRLICRIHMENLTYDNQCDLIFTIDKFFNFELLGMDEGSNGLAVSQILKSEKMGWNRFVERQYAKRLITINFSSRCMIGKEKGKPVMKDAKQAMTDFIIAHIERQKAIFPIDKIDTDIEFQFRNHTYSISPSGRIIYDKSSPDHIIDASRTAFYVKVLNKLARPTQLPTSAMFSTGNVNSRETPLSPNMRNPDGTTGDYDVRRYI